MHVILMFLIICVILYNTMKSNGEFVVNDNVDITVQFVNCEIISDTSRCSSKCTFDFQTKHSFFFLPQDVIQMALFYPQ